MKQRRLRVPSIIKELQRDNPIPPDLPPLDIQTGHNLENGNVLIQLSQPVQFFVLPPDKALAFGELVVKEAKSGQAVASRRRERK